ncbi:unnamed protein product [Brassica rapa]|uniref:Uncharacterized protein n=1 Tax=Brassica campestris TaxID=3711 RepID=A0A8D9CUL7_BRACM|nr:unnamed protein product [Brassica rapa]
MSAFSSAHSTKLAFISNLEGQSKPMKRRSKICFSSKEYTEKLEKALPFALLFLENMTLIKALAHSKVTIFLFYDKSFDLSGVEFQKPRINLRNVQEKNLQLAQANSHTLDELSTNRDRACFSGIEVAQNEAFLFHYIAASMTN